MTTSSLSGVTATEASTHLSTFVANSGHPTSSARCTDAASLQYTELLPHSLLAASPHPAAATVPDCSSALVSQPPFSSYDVHAPPFKTAFSMFGAIESNFSPSSSSRCTSSSPQFQFPILTVGTLDPPSPTLATRSHISTDHANTVLASLQSISPVPSTAPTAVSILPLQSDIYVNGLEYLPPVRATIGTSTSLLPNSSLTLLDASSSPNTPRAQLKDSLTPSSQLRSNITKGSRFGRTSRWSQQEDELLAQWVEHYDGKNWKRIAASAFGANKSDVQCLHRWQKVIKPGLVKGPWTNEEDDKVVELVQKFGIKRWSFIASHLQGRLGKQCRERWFNHLNPAIKRDLWTTEEDQIIISAHAELGSKWASIARRLPGRTDNSIKNRWHSILCHQDGLAQSGTASVDLDLGLSAPKKKLRTRRSRPQSAMSSVKQHIASANPFLIDSGNHSDPNGGTAFGKLSEHQCNGHLVIAESTLAGQSGLYPEVPSSLLNTPLYRKRKNIDNDAPADNVRASGHHAFVPPSVEITPSSTFVPSRPGGLFASCKVSRSEPYLVHERSGSRHDSQAAFDLLLEVTTLPIHKNHNAASLTCSSHALPDQSSMALEHNSPLSALSCATRSNKRAHRSRRSLLSRFDQSLEPSTTPINNSKNLTISERLSPVHTPESTTPASAQAGAAEVLAALSNNVSINQLKANSSTSSLPASLSSSTLSTHVLSPLHADQAQSHDSNPESTAVISNVAPIISAHHLLKLRSKSTADPDMAALRGLSSLGMTTLRGKDFFSPVQQRLGGHLIGRDPLALQAWKVLKRHQSRV